MLEDTFTAIEYSALFWRAQLVTNSVTIGYFEYSSSLVLKFKMRGKILCVAYTKTDSEVRGVGSQKLMLQLERSLWSSVGQRSEDSHSCGSRGIYFQQQGVWWQIEVR